MEMPDKSWRWTTNVEAGVAAAEGDWGEGGGDLWHTLALPWSGKTLEEDGLPVWTRRGKPWLNLSYYD